jgi:hypothetical protein
MRGRPMAKSSRKNRSRRSEEADQIAFIADQELLDRFVTPQMIGYFRAKMPTLKSGVLEHRLCELLKYLILVRFSPGRILFGREVDDVWHCWILQTRQYAQLCEQLPGRCFRHHSSVDYHEAAETSENVSIPEAVQRILSFFISYYRNFGPITDDRVECWPTLQQLMQRAGWDLDRTNEFLRDQSRAAARQLTDGNRAAA